MVCARSRRRSLVGHLVETRPPRDVALRVSEAQPAAVHGHMDRVHEGGVEALRIIAVRLIHPTLRETSGETSTNIPDKVTGRFLLPAETHQRGFISILGTPRCQLPWQRYKKICRCNYGCTQRIETQSEGQCHSAGFETRHVCLSHLTAWTPNGARQAFSNSFTLSESASTAFIDAQGPHEGLLS